MPINPGSKFVIDVVAQANKSSFSTAQQIINQFALTQQKLGVIAQNTTTITNQLANAQNNLNKAMGGGTAGGRNKGWIDTIAWGTALGKVYSNIASYLTNIIEKIPIMGEELYYMNRRLGLPGTTSLFNVAFAGSMIGLSREQTLGSVESMAAAARTNPGIAALMRQFGARTTGGEFSPEDQLALVNRLSKLPYFVGAQFAQTMGMDENTYRQMTTNLQELNEQYRYHNTIIKEFGINTDKTSKDFREFDNTLRQITDKITVILTEWTDWAIRTFGQDMANTVNKGLEHAGIAIGGEGLQLSPRGKRAVNTMSELGKSIVEGARSVVGLPTEKGVNLAEVNPELLARTKKEYDEAPEEAKRGFKITSGFRTWQQQLYLYTHPNKYPVAKPGQSPHGKGLALDIQDTTGYFHRHAAEYGLGFPVKGDYPHMELIGGGRAPGSYESVRAAGGQAHPNLDVDVTHAGASVTINNYGSLDSDTLVKAKTLFDNDSKMFELRMRTAIESAIVR
jgi:hypothetical protein